MFSKGMSLFKRAQHFFRGNPLPFADALSAVKPDLLRSRLEQLCGEADVTINGVATRLRTRNSFSSGMKLGASFLRQYYTALGLKVATHTYEVGTAKLENVVAEILGDLTPEEVVVVGSHFDSTAGHPRLREAAAPGADDDGTGTVAAMEIAAQIMFLKSLGFVVGRTIRFVHFSGEEQGTLGSKEYVKTLKKLGDIVVAMFQLEMMGYTGDGTNRVDLHDDGNEKAHELAACLMEMAKVYELPLKPVDCHAHFAMRPSDHWSFLEAGIPAVCISEDSTDEGINPAMHTTGDLPGRLQFDFFANVVRMLIAAIARTASVRRPLR